jgi:hypothetical protein
MKTPLALDLFGGQEAAFNQYKSYLRWLLRDLPTQNINLIERQNNMAPSQLYLFITASGDLKPLMVQNLCKQLNIIPPHVLRNPQFTLEPPNRKQDWINYFKEKPMKIRMNGNKELECICDITEAVSYLAHAELFGQNNPTPHNLESGDF